MIQRVAGRIQGPAAAQARPRQGQGGDFGALLQQELAKCEQPVQSVAFSKHAISRAEERGIQVTAITQEEMRESVFTNIDGAVFL